MNLKASLLFIFSLALCYSCSTSKQANVKPSVKNQLENKNRMTVSLLDQISRLKGMSIRYGVPFFIKSANSFSTDSNMEPLYVLDDFIVGNSFKSLDQLVFNVNIAKIEVLSDAEASIYGSRASSGVIVITTKK